MHTSVISDHVNGFDPIAKLLLQCFRYTSGNGEIASRGAIANTYLHLFLLCVIVMRQILPHTGAAGKRQLEGVGKKDFGSLSRAEDMPTFMWFLAIIPTMAAWSKTSEVWRVAIQKSITHRFVTRREVGKIRG